MTVHSGAALDPRTDPRYQPGAYIAVGRCLYYVRRWESGAASERLWVTNCRTECDTWITGTLAADSQLVKRAPELAVADTPTP